MSGSNENDKQPFIDPFAPQLGARRKKDDAFNPDRAVLADKDGFDPNRATEVKKTWGERLKDTAMALGNSGVAGGEAVVGLGNILTNGHAGKALENAGVDLKGAHDFYNERKSLDTKVQTQRRTDTESVMGKVGVLMDNPTQIFDTTVESVAPMLVGAAIGRGVKAVSPGTSAVTSGAIGEGAAMAGSQAEQIRQQNDSGLLENHQYDNILTTGALGAAIGLAGGQVAKRLGLEDVDTAFAQGGLSNTGTNSLLGVGNKVILGALTEGFVEELPQTVVETILQNDALGKPWHEGLTDAAVMGVAAGAAMGGGTNAYSAGSQYLANRNSQNPQNPQATQGPQGPQGPQGSPNLPAPTQSVQNPTLPASFQNTQGVQSTPILNPNPSTPITNAAIVGANTGTNPLPAVATPQNPVPVAGPLSQAANLALGIQEAQTSLTTEHAQEFLAAEQSEVSPATAQLYGNTIDGFSTEVGEPQNLLGFNGESQTGVEQDNSQVPTNYRDLNTPDMENPSSEIQTGWDLGREGADTSVQYSVDRDGQVVEIQNEPQAELQNEPQAELQNEPQAELQNEPQAELQNEPQTEGVRKGVVGDKLAAKEVVQTVTGRETTPFPEFKNGRGVLAKNAEAKANKWLIENAHQEALARGDRMNAAQFEATLKNLKNISQADKDSAEIYLFDQRSVPKQELVKNDSQATESLQSLKDISTDVEIDGPTKMSEEGVKKHLEKIDGAIERIDNSRQRLRENNPEVFTPENDAVRETHGINNGRVKLIADSLAESGRYELSDREFAKVKNNPNFKIEVDPNTEIPYAVGVKKPETGEWVGKEPEGETETASKESTYNASAATTRLDHGILNVPLNKRGNIDAQIDNYKAEQKLVDRNRKDELKAEYAKASEEAKSHSENLSEDVVKEYARRAEITPIKARKELRDLAKDNPKKALQVYKALESTVREQVVEKSSPETTSKQFTPEKIMSDIDSAADIVDLKGLKNDIEMRKGLTVPQRNQARKRYEERLKELQGKPVKLNEQEVAKALKDAEQRIGMVKDPETREGMKKLVLEEARKNKEIVARKDDIEAAIKKRYEAAPWGDDVRIDYKPIKGSLAFAVRKRKHYDNEAFGADNPLANAQYLSGNMRQVDLENDLEGTIARMLDEKLGITEYDDKGNLVADHRKGQEVKTVTQKADEEVVKEEELAARREQVKAERKAQDEAEEKAKIAEEKAKAKQGASYNPDPSAFENQTAPKQRKIVNEIFKDVYEELKVGLKDTGIRVDFTAKGGRIDFTKTGEGKYTASVYPTIKEGEIQVNFHSTHNTGAVWSEVSFSEMNTEGLLRAAIFNPLVKLDYVFEKHFDLATQDAKTNVEIASVADDVNTTPSEAQIESGNYKKAHVSVAGLDITIENPKGSTRSGTDPNGKAWSHTMSNHYGYIKKTEGADGEHIDVYVGGRTRSGKVYVVDQINQADGKFDEHKVMLGYSNKPQAIEAYRSNFDKGWHVGNVTEMTMEQFKTWLKNADTTVPMAIQHRKIVEVAAKKAKKSNSDNLTRDQYKAIHEKLISEIESAIKVAPKSGLTVPEIHVETTVNGRTERLKITYAGVPKAVSIGSAEDVLNNLPKGYRRSTLSSENDANVAKVERALEEYKSVNGDKPLRITFKTVNGTTYDVTNTKESLEKFLKKVKSNPGFKPVVQRRESNAIPFAKISGLKAMLQDTQDSYAEFNAYYYAKSAEIPTVFYRDNRGQVGAKFITSDAGTLEGNNLYISVVNKSSKDLTYQITDDYGNNLQTNASEASLKATWGERLKNLDKPSHAGSKETVRDVYKRAYAKMAQNTEPQDVLQQLYEDQLNERFNADGALNSTATSTPKNKQTASQVREKLVERFGEDVISALEKQGKLKIVDNIEGLDQRVEGFYEGGRVTLVAGNLDAENVVPTFLHELGGHAGFQGMMSDKQYQNLMEQFDRLVAEGDTMALRAKQLAERELDPDTQRLEMLPYLLTLAAQQSSTTNQKGVLGLISKLVSNVKAWAFDKLGVNLKLKPQDFVALADRMIVKAANPNTKLRSPSNQRLHSMQSFTQTITDSIGTYMKDTPGHLSWWHKTLGSMYNLAERKPAFKPVFLRVQKFIDDLSYFSAVASEKAPTLLPRIDGLRDMLKTAITKNDNDAIGKAIFEGTLFWGRDSNGNLYDTRLPAHTKKVPGTVFTDSELQSNFNLTDAQIALYREFRAATENSLDNLAKTEMLRMAGKISRAATDSVLAQDKLSDAYNELERHLYQEISNIAGSAQMVPVTTKVNGVTTTNLQMDPKAVARMAEIQSTIHDVKDIYKRTTNLKIKGYAPLMRFGKYSVAVYDGNELDHFGMYESRTEAEAAYQSLKRVYQANPNARFERGTMSEQDFTQTMGVSMETAALFGEMLKLNQTGSSAADVAFQEYLRKSRSQRSALKRMIHRKGIDGYSVDVTRVLASFVLSNSRRISSNLNVPQINEHIQAIPKTEGQLRDAAIELKDFVVNPQEKGGWLRSVMFAQYLGGSVSSAIVNLTQTFAVTMPWLTQHTSVLNANTQIVKARAELIGAALGRHTPNFSANLQTAIKRAEEDGKLSPQEIFQLMEQAQGNQGLRSKDGTVAGDLYAMGANSMVRFSVLWGRMFGLAEQINRRVTFIASYRIAEQEGMPNPEEFARKAVDETQFVLSKASKMKWGRGNTGALLLTFKSYMVFYLELASRMWNEGQPGSPERFRGRRAVIFMAGALILMGGVGGLPFVEDLDDAIDGLGQLMGYNFSSQQKRKEFLETLPLGGFLEKGVSEYMPLDVSNRLGMGNLIPGTSLLTKKEDYSRDMMEIGGPAADFISRIFRGSRMMLEGDVGKGILEPMPLAIRNAFKGLEMGTTGEYRNTKGEKVIDVDGGDALLKSIGFQPSDVAKVQDGNFQMQKEKSFYNMKVQEIRKEWARAIYDKDSEGIAKARQKMLDWNEKNPNQPIRADMRAIMKRVRDMRKTKAEKIADSAPKALRQRMRQDVNALYDEVGYDNTL